MTEKKFVCINVDLEDVRKHEIGMVIDETENTYTVEFQRKRCTVKKSLVSIIDISKTGDSYDVKICNRCWRLLPTTAFERNQNGVNNRPVRRPSCRECREDINGIPMPAAEKRKWEAIKPNYEIWECPICKKRTIPGVTSKVVLDHDHETGKGRAWICDSCNTGLGRFKDDIQTLENAIAYLKSTKKIETQDDESQ